MRSAPRTISIGPATSRDTVGEKVQTELKIRLRGEWVKCECQGLEKRSGPWGYWRHLGKRSQRLDLKIFKEILQLNLIPPLGSSYANKDYSFFLFLPHGVGLEIHNCTLDSYEIYKKKKILSFCWDCLWFLFYHIRMWVHAQSLQLYPSLCDPMDHSLILCNQRLTPWTKDWFSATPWTE